MGFFDDTFKKLRREFERGYPGLKKTRSLFKKIKSPKLPESPDAGDEDVLEAARNERLRMRRLRGRGATILTQRDDDVLGGVFGRGLG